MTIQAKCCSFFDEPVGWANLSTFITLFMILCLLLLAVFYVQAGYFGLMWFLARKAPQPSRQNAPMPDAVSLILCLHNGAEKIQQRLQNLAACHWHGQREIIVFCDGCTDHSAQLATESPVAGVRVLAHPEQRGKWAALNDAIKAAAHPIIIFADLRQTFDEQALQRLAAAFQDDQTGAVSGLLEIATSDTGSGRGVDLYWRMERKLREWEARYDSVIGCTGAIYAIRKELFTELPPGTILDDVVVPMQIAHKGYRIRYEPAAIAYDPQTLEPEKEKVRKLRTLVGNYQMMELFPEWAIPGKGRLWWQLISHKYARLTVPWLLLLTALVSLLTAKTPLIWLLIIAQTLCYSLGLLGCWLPHLRSRLITIPAGFLLLQWSCTQALFGYIRSRRDPLSLWKPTTKV